MDQILKYTCPKCGNKQYEIGEIKVEWTFRTIWRKMFELHNRRFTSVSCTMCHYTEFYKVSKNEIGETINFISR